MTIRVYVVKTTFGSLSYCTLAVSAAKYCNKLSSVTSEHFLLFSLRAFSYYRICSRTLPEAECLITVTNSSLVVYLL